MVAMRATLQDYARRTGSRPSRSRARRGPSALAEDLLSRARRDRLDRGLLDVGVVGRLVAEALCLQLVLGARADVGRVGLRGGVRLDAVLAAIDERRAGDRVVVATAGGQAGDAGRADEQRGYKGACRGHSAPFNGGPPGSGRATVSDPPRSAQRLRPPTRLPCPRFATASPRGSRGGRPAPEPRAATTPHCPEPATKPAPPGHTEPARAPAPARRARR